ncbi:MAG: C45 family autoproteolytic acyltransferase/hydrolase [Pseudomonadota bacterium]|uniref:C45 family autoproteolytic acyltransferase/hydolase n=1 Tax=Roseovarius TaxID=74030 RepID=UPI0022A84948|nr:C45 family peptidase [Roseovarius sp. EGI FJ00037]MCZ0813488.1 C45 family autoproteolytic acyltransferase/hydrolase [Roseovarius sp. EGI FJ00037]
MSEPAPSELGSVAAHGTPRQIGRALGEAGRAAVRDVLLHADYWHAVTDSAHAGAVRRMGDNLRRLYPAVWEELQGLAEGLDLPLEQVVAWNSRGDLMSNVPDGCTTVQIPGDIPVIGHNEDGLPGFRGHAFVASLTPDDGPALTSFCYPGSLPGHTFGINDAGLVQAVNNLRLHNVTAQVPRIGLGRAVLACSSLDEALAGLDRHNASGGFHMTLAQAGDPRVMSVEFGAGACSAQVIEAPSIHANHALHLGLSDTGQTVTRSSRDRQARGMDMLVDGVTDPLTILRDVSGPGLPIHRCQPDDPDNENTLATAVFHVGRSGVDWSIYDQNSDRPVVASH